MECGPNQNVDLVTLLLNSRQYNVKMIADIKKAFLHISVKEEYRNALRLL